jgi:hypothetical protein
MGHFTIAAYRPFADKDAELLEEIKTHVPILRELGLATDRPSYVMRAKDGTIIEVFEWKSKEAVEQAHTNPGVLAMWERFGKVCEYAPLTSLSEADEMFAQFEPIDF